MTSGRYNSRATSPAWTSNQWMRRLPPYALATAASSTLAAQVVMPGVAPTSRPMPSPRIRQTIGSSGTFGRPVLSTVTRVPDVGGVSFS